MNTNWKSMVRFSRISALLVLFAGLSISAYSQERVAQLSKVDGGVTITKAESPDVREAKQVGPRVKNGSVYAGEVVATDKSGTATLWFSDGSEVQLKPGTKLSIQELDFASLVKSGQKDKPAGRKIKVLAGNIWTHVIPNPQIATEFETPSGVAAVKGTELEIGVESDGSGDVKTVDGSVLYTTIPAGIVLHLPKGHGATFRKLLSGIELLANSANPGALIMDLPNGQSFSASPSSNLQANVAGFGVSFAVKSGNVTGGNGKAVNAGDAVNYGHAAFSSTENVPTTIRTEEGAVVFSSPTHGLSMVLTAGNGGTLTERPSGRVSVQTPSTNKTPVAVTVGGKTSNVNAGSNVVTSSGGNLVAPGTPDAPPPSGEKNTTSSTSTTKTSTSSSTNSSPTTTQTQKPCGECGVPDGNYDCSYVDSLCPDLACVKNRTCSHGVCTGGRPVTSKDGYPDCGQP